MRSLIIIEVEHGEDTDALELMAVQVCRNAADFGATVTDYTVRVDLPECFRLDTNSVAPVWCEDCDTDHDPGKCPLGG